MIDGLRIEIRQPTSRSAHNLSVVHILARTCHLSTLVKLLFDEGQLIQDLIHPCILLILDIALDHLPQTTHLLEYLGRLDPFVVLDSFHRGASVAATSRHSETLVLPSQILGPHPFHSPLQLVIFGSLSFIFRLPVKGVIVNLLPG